MTLENLRFQILATILALSLSGCDLIYQSQNVVAGPTDAGEVQIIELTSETVAVANRSSYRPRALPAAFSQTAGVSGQLMGAGALPEPAYTAQSRPSAMVTRLPPDAAQIPYRIGVGDVVLLATSGAGADKLAGILAAQNSRQGFTVQDDGAIAIPSVGRIEIAGRTIEEAEGVIFQRFVEAQIDPAFSLEISQFNSKRVSVGGAVSTPTVVPITLTPLYLDELIAQAGGVTAEDIDYATVRLYRDGTLYQVPLTEMYSNSNIRRIPVQAGDSVFVDTAYELDQASAYFEQQIQLAGFRQSARVSALNALNAEIAIRRNELAEARSNYSAAMTLDAVERDYVYLTGELKSPGRLALPFERQANLADALYDEAGGLLPLSSDPRQVYVLRGSADSRNENSIIAWHLNAKNAANMILATRFELRPNDIVFVSEKPVTKWGRTITQITPTIINVGAKAVGN